MINFIVGAKFCTQSFQMRVRFSLLVMLSLYWDAEEFPENKTRADFPFKISVEFKQGIRQLQGSVRICRSFANETNKRNSLNSCSAPEAPHLDHLQQLTARFGAVSIELCMVVPFSPALRNWSLYSFSPIQNRAAERSKHMQVPISAVRHFETEIIKHASLTWHKMKFSLTLLDYGSNSPFSHQIVPVVLAKVCPPKSTTRMLSERLLSLCMYRMMSLCQCLWQRKESLNFDYI